MKKIILSGDNVIVSIAIKKKLIELPEGAINVEVGETGYPEIVEISKRAKEFFPELEIGKKCVLNPAFDPSKSPIMNIVLGMPDPNKDKETTHVYFLVKSFDITGIIAD
jgi:hypothetical protein